MDALRWGPHWPGGFIHFLLIFLFGAVKQNKNPPPMTQSRVQMSRREHPVGKSTAVCSPPPTWVVAPMWLATPPLSLCPSSGKASPWFRPAHHVTSPRQFNFLKKKIHSKLNQLNLNIKIKLNWIRTKNNLIEIKFKKINLKLNQLNLNLKSNQLKLNSGWN